MNTPVTNFADLDALAEDLRTKLSARKYLLLFAYNGTGKTRLSMAFKDARKQDGGRDTLYFNAFTEDLFLWDNDLEHDSQRVLRLNTDSSFFEGLEALEMDNRIRPFLQPLVDFDFRIDTDNWTISFSRNTQVTQEGGSVENVVIEDIKISRGEERIFVWCFFLAIAQLAIDAQEGQPYDWVKFLYIDDPISSLDDNNAIAVASRLAQLLKSSDSQVKSVISTHHTLFFNVLCNELSRPKRKLLGQYFLNGDNVTGDYGLRYTDATPFFHHVAMLKELRRVEETGEIYTYHFGILRSLLEKSATFHGYNNFSACLKPQDDDPEGIIHARLINLLSHGDYSHFEPVRMLPENKQYFSQILNGFMETYRFNPEIFPEPAAQGVQP
ncbi:MAG: AAA family ATPase [Sulfitobacter sp.]